MVGSIYAIGMNRIERNIQYNSWPKRSKKHSISFWIALCIVLYSPICLLLFALSFLLLLSLLVVNSSLQFPPLSFRWPICFCFASPFSVSSLCFNVLFGQQREEDRPVFHSSFLQLGTRERLRRRERKMVTGSRGCAQTRRTNLAFATS